MSKQGVAVAEQASAAYLERNIKDLLVEYPTLGEVLSSYSIGCVSCSVGTCQLKDIVQFHSLPPAELQALMYRIARTIDPTGDFPAPQFDEAPAAPRQINYSPPMRELVQEHMLIKRMLALIPDILARIDLESEADRQLLRDAVDFIRSYADRFHHAKEEEILFKHFDEGREIIRVMLEDHTAGRNHVRAVLEAVECRDAAGLAEHLTGYGALLQQHITKEDDILYPWMDRELSDSQIGELYREFHTANRQFAPDMRERYESFITRLEQTMKGN